MNRSKSLLSKVHSDSECLFKIKAIGDVPSLWANLIIFQVLISKLGGRPNRKLWLLYDCTVNNATQRNARKLKY